MTKLLANIVRLWKHPLFRSYGWYGLIAAAAISYVEIRLGIANNPELTQRLSKAADAIYEVVVPPTDEPVDLPPEPPAVDSNVPPPLPPPARREVPRQVPNRGVPPLSKTLEIDNY